MNKEEFLKGYRKAKHKQQMKDWFKEHSDYQKEYYKEHKEEILEKFYKWRDENKLYRREYERRKRYKLKPIKIKKGVITYK